MSHLWVDTNFPGGGVANVEIRGRVVFFEAPLDNGTRSLWYYFKLHGCAGQRITLVQRGMEHVLGIFESRGYRPVVPVIRDGQGDWTRVGEEGIVYSEHLLFFQFEVLPEHDVCEVAFCYPYVQRNWLAFEKTLPQNLLKCEEIGRTKENRPYLRYWLSDPDAKPRDFVVLTARQHAGEVSGSYVLEGLLKRLTDGSPEMKKLLTKTAFCILPIVDLDCVETGKYGKDQLPVDMNRNWIAHPYHPEIASFQSDLERLSQHYHLLWAFDLHAPQPGAASYMPPSRSALPQSESWNRMWNMALAYESKCAGKISFHLNDVDTEVLNWGGANNHGQTDAYYARRWNCNATCFEYSYHRTAEDKLLEKSDWRLLGSLLAETIAEKLYDEALSDTPDMSRIPAWTLPARLQAWSPLQRIDGMTVLEEANTLLLTPVASQNHAWLLSPETSFLKRLKLMADASCTVELYVSYYQKQLLLHHSNTVFVSLEKGRPFHWKQEHLIEGADASAIGIHIRNLPCDLAIEWIAE